MFLECRGFIIGKFMFDLPVIVLFYYWCVDNCDSWLSMYTWMQMWKMLMEQIGTYKQCYVYNTSHIDVCFEGGKKWN